MNRISKFLLMMMACAVTPLVHAGSVENATVLNIAIYKSYGNFVFIQLNTPTVAPATCAVSTVWQFTLPLEGAANKELYAMLLLAKATGKRVNIAGTGTCSEYGASESLMGMYLLD